MATSWLQLSEQLAVELDGGLHKQWGVVSADWFGWSVGKLVILAGSELTGEISQWSWSNWSIINYSIYRKLLILTLIIQSLFKSNLNQKCSEVLFFSTSYLQTSLYSSQLWRAFSLFSFRNDQSIKKIANAANTAVMFCDIHEGASDGNGSILIHS